MKINVSNIDSIEPQYEMRAPSTLNINVCMSVYQQEKMFLQIWDNVGDEVLNKWLECEGKKLVTKEPVAL